MSYADTNNDGKITASSNPNTNEIIEEKNYYPFGLEHKGYNNVVNGTEHPYKYNGKELNEELGLNWYDYGARNYQADLGRWMNIDPLAEKYVDFSTYHYSGNSPILFRDVDGRYFVGADGKPVTTTVNDNGQIQLSSNATADLTSLVESVNSSGSSTAIGQIMNAGSNKSRINVRIENEVHDKPGQAGYGLFGVHQAHDKDGNILEWDSEKGDFNGTPEYVEGEEGVYKEATITVFSGNIKKAGKEGSNGSYYGFDITVDQETANTFQHETNHNTDKEFIKDLKNKREGKKNKGIDPHKNIDPQEQKVYREMEDSNKKKN